MGAAPSALGILSAFTGEETVTEIASDGEKTMTKRENPVIAGLTITAVTILSLAYMDGGTGMFTKSFGKVCLKCSEI